jgi:lipoprotein NlpD
MPQTMSRCRNRTLIALIALAAAVLAGCSTGARAPVEDRSHAQRALPPAVAVQPSRPVPGAPDAASGSRFGYYTVRPGDTLIRIALDAGQNSRDIARWNNIENPNVIEIGQVLRVAPPGASSAAEVATVRPVTPATGSPVPPVQGGSEPRPAVAARPDAGDDEVPWGWPTAGAPVVLAGFDEARNKGLDIGGKAGDPVLASADGRVVYAGAGLRGYGNLIILKHNNTYLTAYAHNQALLVKEDQTVRKGQKIAEMGNSDADRVKLHFEIRKQGKPVDPTKYLPR